jgi:multicomponent Na+:H+ antiporter subunit A
VLFALLGLHAILAVLAPLIARRLGRGVFLVLALAPGATTAYAFSRWPQVVGPAAGEGGAVRESFAWAPSLGLDATLRLDAFALLMVGLVAGIGTIIFVYAYGYFSKPRDDLGRFAGALVGFAGAMLGLVLSDNLLLVFVFWELTSITSFLLIGFEDRKAAARDAALQALLTTGLGGLALLGGIVLIGQSVGTYSLADLATAGVPAGGTTNAALVLILLGCFTKSAQVPFHTWLPGAMAAPTPVSAYLHSATMVKAGVYLIARLAPIFAVVGPWRAMVVTVGSATMLLGAWRALRQHDLKLLLAFGTVSQLGFLTLLLGVGTPKATFAGTALLLSHGLFKASLFMIVGIVDKQAGTRDLRRLHGLGRVMPAVAIAAFLGGASMMGLPPLLGFIAKETAYEAFVRGGFGPLAPPALVVIVAGSALTFAYAARFLHGAFARKPLGVTRLGDVVDASTVGRPRPVLAFGAVLLAVLGLLFGILPVVVDGLVNAAAAALQPLWEYDALALWHGVNLALSLSIITVLVGAGAFLARVGVEGLQERMPVLYDSKQGYDATIRGLLGLARRLTGVVQNGSLPAYQAVILATLLVLPGSALATGGNRLELPELAAGWGQLVVCLIVVVAAVAAILARRRFAAVLLLGAVGFGVAVLFVIHGAPDLALTQLLIETLTLVIFVLVLRHLPDRFTRPPVAVDRIVRAVVAGGVGVFVFFFALVASAARTAPPVSAEFLARAYPEADGRNVVNVILVDFRALDTLGEITVLVVAAMGIASLVMASRGRRGAGGEEMEHEPGEPGGGAPRGRLTRGRGIR